MEGLKVKPYYLVEIFAFIEIINEIIDKIIKTGINKRNKISNTNNPDKPSLRNKNRIIEEGTKSIAERINEILLNLLFNNMLVPKSKNITPGINKAITK